MAFYQWTEGELEMKKIIDGGMQIPKGYGIAWRDFARDQAICYPLILNLIFRWIREIYFWICVPKHNYWEKRELIIHEYVWKDALKMIEQRVKQAEKKIISDINESVKYAYKKVYGIPLGMKLFKK